MNVSRQPVLSRALALKGGTALNLCFGPPRRLSVDLDFNYIANVERERMLVLIVLMLVTAMFDHLMNPTGPEKHSDSYMLVNRIMLKSPDRNSTTTSSPSPRRAAGRSACPSGSTSK